MIRKHAGDLRDRREFPVFFKVPFEKKWPSSLEWISEAKASLIGLALKEQSILNEARSHVSDKAHQGS
jgi:hypothetical protein